MINLDTRLKDLNYYRFYVEMCVWVADVFLPAYIRAINTSADINEMTLTKTVIK